VPEQRFPLQPLVKTVVTQAVPLQPMEVHSGADIHLQPVEDPMPEQVDDRRRLWPCGKPVLEQVSARTCGERDPHWIRFAGRTCDPMGTHAGTVCSLRTAPHGKDPFWSSSGRSEGPMLENFVEDCLPWGRTLSGVREESEESSPWGRRSSRDNVWWTDRKPHSPSTCAAQGEELAKIGSKVKPGMKWGVGGKVF